MGSYVGERGVGLSKAILWSVDSSLPPKFVDVLTGQCLAVASEADFVQRAPYATVAILSTRSVAGPCLKLLKSIEMASPSLPLLIITTFTPENARALVRVQLSSVVWTVDPPGHLRAEVARLRNKFRISPGSLTHLERVAPALARAFRLIEFGATIVSVQGLARAIHCDPTTLRRQWRARFTTGSLKELVDWGVLLRASYLASKGTTRLQAARSVGVHQTTLARIAKRLSGHSLGEFWQDPALGSIRFRVWLETLDLRRSDPESPSVLDSVRNSLASA